MFVLMRNRMILLVIPITYIIIAYLFFTINNPRVKVIIVQFFNVGWPTEIVKLLCIYFRN